MTMFFLQMVLNQDVQKRAQKEIDSVVGFDRLPSSRDRPSIKYLDCILKEVLRYGTVSRHSTLDTESAVTESILPHHWEYLMLPFKPTNIRDGRFQQDH